MAWNMEQQCSCYWLLNWRKLCKIVLGSSHLPIAIHDWQLRAAWPWWYNGQWSKTVNDNWIYGGIASRGFHQLAIVLQEKNEDSWKAWDIYSSIFFRINNRQKWAYWKNTSGSDKAERWGQILRFYHNFITEKRNPYFREERVKQNWKAFSRAPTDPWTGANSESFAVTLVKGIDNWPWYDDVPKTTVKFEPNFAPVNPWLLWRGAWPDWTFS